MILDLADTELDRLRAEVCVIGTGPAGMTVALELARRGVDVCLLEGGGLEPEEPNQALYEGELVGPVHPALSDYPMTSRLRYFGGSSNHWGGWCRPLDPVDFEARDWIPMSGWPFSREQLDPWYQRAAGIIDIKPMDYDPAADPLPDRQPLRLGDDALIRTDLFHFSRTRFAGKYRASIEASQRIRCVLHANVTQIELAPDGGLVQRLRVATLGGREVEVGAQTFVLATGGIENARLLLASNGVHKSGIGNAHDLVGRYFMDHMDLTIGHLVVTRTDRPLGLYEVRNDAVYPHRRVGVLSPTAAAMRRHRLRNCGLRLDKRVSLEDLDDHTRAFVGMVGATDRARPIDERGPALRVSTLRLAAEATPHPDSRVRLREDRDALGLPRVRIDWKVAREDIESVLATHRLLARELGSIAAGRVRITAGLDGDEPDWEALQFRVCKHHMGTTRMAEDPKQGVTDGDGKVHGVANLHVAGSSLFPTGGYSNPTFTIVALALRLADHLARKMDR